MDKITRHDSVAGPVYFCHENLRHETIRHGFFTRLGGVSRGLYHSLNCGLGSQDKRAHVLKNRELVAASLKIPQTRMLGMIQSHSSICHILRTPDELAAGRVEADSLVTALPNIALAVLTADCLPLLLADHKNGIIGACHAGWRGAVGGVIEATLKSMTELGGDLNTTTMRIGPAIQQANYQIDADLKTHIVATHPDAQLCFAHDPAVAQKYLFDLPRFAAQKARAAGVGEIYDVGLDSYGADDLFFSYRRACHKGEAESGRQISVIISGT